MKRLLAGKRNKNVPFFSIIIPHLNQLSELKLCLFSLQNQSFQNFEVIIIDGGSKDGTLEFLKAHLELFTLLIHGKDKNVYDAMNWGISYSKGKYLYFLGVDDRFYNDNILYFVNRVLKEKACDFLYGNVRLKEKNKIYYSPTNKIELTFKNICQQAIFYNRRLFELLGYFNINYNIMADYAFNLKCFDRKELKIRFLPLIIAVYSTQGISGYQKDVCFLQNRLKLIYSNLGLIYCLLIFPKILFYNIKKIYYKIYQVVL